MSNSTSVINMLTDINSVSKNSTLFLLTITKSNVDRFNDNLVRMYLTLFATKPYATCEVSAH